MKPALRFAIALVAVLVLLTSAVIGSDGRETVEVLKNQVKLRVNGESVQIDSLMLGDTPYVPLIDFAGKAGMEITWNQAMRTASVRDIHLLKLQGKVDPYKPVINLEELGLQAGQIEAVQLEREGQRVPRITEFAGNTLTLRGDAASGVTVLELNTAYTLKLFTSNNARYQVDFLTASLPDITGGPHRQVVLVPAMPEKGFHWPYFLAVPSSVLHDATHKRYLMVDINNTGTSNNVAEMLSKTRTEIEGRRQLSMGTADQLGLPFLYPAFPRPGIMYTYEGESNIFYTHSLDRDTATMHVKMGDPKGAAALTEAFQKAGFDAKQFLNLDQQLNAMIDHAIAYLNQYGHKVEPKKVFLSGYSASGTFTDRYALLHPDRVKALASGATLDDMVLPLAEYRGKKLIFPIGTSDYREITGRAFDLGKHNQVARLIFMGEDDTNNTLPYGDCYGERERQIITELWGTEVLPRAQALTKLYGESGGKGIFVLDPNTRHGFSSAMSAYVKAFFEANRDSDGPVYPELPAASPLKSTLFR